jgi:hypothetical protein
MVLFEADVSLQPRNRCLHGCLRGFVSPSTVQGTYLEPLPISSLQIHSGQRYSVLIETAAKPSQIDYWWNIQTIWRAPRTFGAAVWSYNTSSNSNLSQTNRPADLNTVVPFENETFGWVDR